MDRMILQMVSSNILLHTSLMLDKTGIICIQIFCIIMTRKTNTHIVLGTTAEGSLHSLHFEAGAMPQLSQWCARIHIEMPFLYSGDILRHPHRSYYRLGHFVFQLDYSLLYTGTPAILPYCYRKNEFSDDAFPLKKGIFLHNELLKLYCFSCLGTLGRQAGHT